MTSPTEKKALDTVRNSWNRIAGQWDELRKEQPGQDDLLCLINLVTDFCAIMPRKTFLVQFRPPSGFEHLRKPAGDVSPTRERASTMWVLAIERDQHACFRVTRHQSGEIEMDEKIIVS